MLTSQEQAYFYSLRYDPSFEINPEPFILDKFDCRDIKVPKDTNLVINVYNAESDITINDLDCYSGDNSIFIDGSISYKQITIENDSIVASYNSGSQNIEQKDLSQRFAEELQDDKELHLDLNTPYVEPLNILNREINGTFLKTPIARKAEDNDFFTYRAIPVGLTLITKQDANQSTVYLPKPNSGYLAAPSLSNNMQVTDAATLAWSLILCLVKRDNSFLTSSLTAITELVINSSFDGLNKYHERITDKATSNLRSVRDNAKLLWALTKSLSYLQDRPLTQRVSLYGKALENRVKQAIDKLKNFLLKSIDPYLSVCCNYLDENDYILEESSLTTTFWVSIALNKSLCFIYDKRAAQALYNVDKKLIEISEASNDVILGSYAVEPHEEINTAKALWFYENKDILELLKLPTTVTSTGLGVYLTGTELDKEKYLEKLLDKPEAELTIEEITYLNLIQTGYELPNGPSHDIRLQDTKAYSSYLNSYQRYIWPTGYSWDPEEKATSRGGVLDSLFKANLEASINTSIETGRLEYTSNLNTSSGEQLDSYKIIFNEQDNTSSIYWRQVIKSILSRKVNSLEAVDELITFLGLNYSKNTRGLYIWDWKVDYDWFASPEYKSFLEKQYNPKDNLPEDYHYLIYYPTHRFLNNLTKLNSKSYIAETDYKSRPVAGFTKYLDCSYDEFIDGELDVTSDSNYAIDALSNYTGKIWLNIQAENLPSFFSYLLSNTVAAGIKLLISVSTTTTLEQKLL